MVPEKHPLVLIYILSGIGFICCCFAGLGFIPAGIAFFLINQKQLELHLNPEAYSNVQEIKIARIVALIILIINGAYFLNTMYTIYDVGWDELMIKTEEMIKAFESQQSIE